jgi:hypothetical protein
MCNRPIKIEDIYIIKGWAWDLKEIKLIGNIRSGMTSYPAEHYLKKEKIKNKEV